MDDNVSIGFSSIQLFLSLSRLAAAFPPGQIRVWKFVTRRYRCHDSHSEIEEATSGFLVDRADCRPRRAAAVDQMQSV